MVAMVRRAGHYALLVMAGAVALAGPGALAARAAAPVGACCLPNGQCLSEIEFVCDGQGGDFIGSDTSCVMIECPVAPVSVPLLSMFGVVAVIGALGGLGVYRLVRRTPR